MKVAIYCRISQDDEKLGESESIQNQREMLLKYTTDRAWDVYDIYIDDGISGISQARPAWRRMLKDCENGNVDIVLCKTQSRFSRDMEITERYINGKFKEWGVRFIGVVDNTDSGNQGTRKTSQILGLTNEWYVEEISHNIRSAHKAMRERGEIITPNPPYGYISSPEDKKKYIIDSEVADNVRKIFEWSSQGIGGHTIAKKLNELDILPPNKYKASRKGGNMGEASRFWSNSTIRNMLRNPTYLGHTVQGKSKTISYKDKKKRKVEPENWCVVENTHEAIITQELWDKVQKRFEEMAIKYKKTEKCETERKWGLFNGKIYCGECGNLFKNSCNYRDDGGFWRCRDRYVKLSPCKTGTVTHKKLVNFVTNELEKIIKYYLKNNKLYEKQSDTKSERPKLKSYQAKIDKVNKILREAFLDKVEGNLTETDFETIALKFQKEKQELEREYSEVLTQIEVKQQRQKCLIENENLMKEFLQNKELTKNLINELIEKIVIHPKDDEGYTRIEIQWNFSEKQTNEIFNHLTKTEYNSNRKKYVTKRK